MNFYLEELKVNTDVAKDRFEWPDFTSTSVQEVLRMDMQYILQFLEVTSRPRLLN